MRGRGPHEGAAMTREGFLDAIRQANISASAFDLSGQGDECYVLSGSGYHWSVYYSERGLERNMAHFVSEADALKHLLRLLEADPTTRL